MRGDMFRLCLQSSSGQLVVQIRYKYHKYCSIFVPDLYFKLTCRWL